LLVKSYPASSLHAISETLKHLKLRHLTCAIEVARSGSAKAAAETMAVTESAISKTLRELEEQLDVRLFERTKKGMALTEAGRQFTNYAHSALESLQVGASLASGKRPGPQSVVKIAAMAVVTATLLPEVVRRFVAAEGDTLVEITSGPSALLLERLRSGYVEVAVGRCPASRDMTGLSFEQLYGDRHSFVTQRNHPLARKDRVEPGSIADYPIVMPPRDSMFWDEVQQYFLARAIRPRASQVEALDLHFCRNYTLGSDAIWIASERAIRGDLASGELLRLAMDSPPFDAPIGIITRNGHFPGAQVTRLVQMVREASTELQELR
jgi:LysR family transcriptional regulator, pca operon transcriptional activator